MKPTVTATHAMVKDSDKAITVLLKQKEQAAQKIISVAALNNYPVAGFMSSLNYYNAYRRKLLPTNLIQAQRDFFGAHTYERIDTDGIFHTEWETAPETVSTKM